MVEQADTRDLKSLGVKSVPVRFRLPAPNKKERSYDLSFLFGKVRNRTFSDADARRTSAATSANTGGVRDNLMASLVQIRRNALRELKEAAYDLGCNAVIGVDFDYITLDPQTANIAGGTTYQPYVFCVTANGNAVVIEKIDE